MSTLQDKVTIVTGAASGIGEAAARMFASAGAKLILADMNQDAGEALASELGGAGGNVRFVTTDISSEDDVKRMVALAIDEFGRLDGAFNNAGVPGDFHDVVECTSGEWNRVIGVNLTGTWLCLKHEIPAMLRSGGGSIVNNASMAGLTGVATMGAYQASKHGVIGLTRSSARDFAGQGIRVNAIAPGTTHTPQLEFTNEGLGFGPDEITRWGEAVPMRRLGLPDDQANAAMFLLSDASSFITGIAVPVDGGMSVG